MTNNNQTTHFGTLNQNFRTLMSQNISEKDIKNVEL